MANSFHPRFLCFNCHEVPVPFFCPACEEEAAELDRIDREERAEAEQDELYEPEVDDDFPLYMEYENDYFFTEPYDREY